MEYPYIEEFSKFPKDLQEHILARVEVKREPMPVPNGTCSERVSRPSYRLYYPPKSVGTTDCVIHVSGGILKDEKDFFDHDWLSNIAHTAKVLCVDVLYTPGDYQRILREVEAIVFEIRLQLIDGAFPGYETKKSKIYIHGSSFGGNAAVTVAIKQLLKGHKIDAVLAISPIGDIMLDRQDRRAYFGLKAEKLFNDIDVGFRKLTRLEPKDWHYNLIDMDDDVISVLPSTLIISPEHDIAFKSTKKFADRAWKCNPLVKWESVDGIHMAKDIGTLAAGRKVFQLAIEHISAARYTIDYSDDESATM